MSDILRQIDEDLRKDRLREIWKSYGLYAVTLILVIILSVIGYQINISLDKSKNEKLVEIYFDAISKDNSSIEVFTKLDELIESDNNYLASIAGLKKVELLLKNGDNENSIIELEKILINEENDVTIRNLAAYKLLMTNIKILNIDDFKSYLGVNESEKSDFNYLFKELLAIKYFLDGDLNNSIQTFQDLINQLNVSPEIILRANKFIELID
tara:strand:+ start:856 stop:1491 length:636 start_codon:yes stop_codon:yes gene_type:complete